MHYAVSHTHPRPHDVAPALEGARVILAIKNFSSVPGVCIARDEWIATENGYRKIQDVEVGSRVWSLGELRPVVNKLCNGTRDTVWVETEHGYRVRVTADHVLHLADGRDIQAKDLIIGDPILLEPSGGGDGYACLPQLNWQSKRSEDHARWAKPEQTPLIPERINEDIAWLMGYLVADGNISRSTEKYGGKVRFTIAISEAGSLDEKIRRIVGEHFGLWRDPTHDTNGGKAAYNLSFNSSSFATWVADLDLKNSVPDFIYQSCESVRAAYLSGFFDGDGSAGIRHGYRCCNKNTKLIRELQLLLLNCGIESHESNGHNARELRVRGYESELLFEDKIGFYIDAKDAVVIEKQRLRKQIKHRYEYGVSRFTGLTPAEPCEVWDLEIDGQPYFSAGGLAVHNCHIGLGVTAANTQKVLRRLGLQTEVWSINKNRHESEAKMLWRMLAQQERAPRPITHVVISSPAWIQPIDFHNLAMRWPNITFVQLNHSGAAYLSIDKFGIRNIREVAALAEEFHNVKVAANNERVVKVISSWGTDCLYLPNLYDTSTFQNPVVPRRLGNTLRLGSFGASRPWKNQLCAAEAALIIGKHLGCNVELYVNSKRPDGGERMIEARAEMFDRVPHATLIQVPWMPWTKFRDLSATMHCELSVSFDETFCVVCADGIAEGVPSVTSAALEWTPRSWWAECEDPTDIANVAIGLIHNPVPAIHQARSLLQKYVTLGSHRWIEFINGHAQTLV